MRYGPNPGSLLAVTLAMALAAGCGGGDSGISGPTEQCEPGTTVDCYTGPDGTEGVGICVGGTAECNADGTGYGPCVGEVTPGSEECLSAGDEDCDGDENEADTECTCVPGTTAPCYTGPAGTEGVGDCVGGEMECEADGRSWGPCVGEVVPATESCDEPGDEDCDGLANEEGAGCLCVPGETLPCYTGPAGTEGVGACVGGEMTCDALGTGYGPCEGEVVPTAETCSSMADEDCDGQVNEEGADCVCVPGSVVPCYTGPPGTENNAPCQGGFKTCNAAGTAYGFCLDEILPTVEICNNNIDEDCSGVADDVPDVDGDGWTRCDNDCCETIQDCAEPAKVNPGAFEVVGNNVDDDCDPSTSDTTDPPPCSTAQDFSVTANDMAMAMDLCQFTTANEPLATRKWGVISAEFRTPDGSTPAANQLTSMQQSQAAVMVNYGNVIVPQMGPTMAGISTGVMRDMNDPGYAGIGSILGFNQQPPASYLAAHGGNLPASSSCNGSCTAGSGANDGVNLRLEIRVPTNALSFAYQFRFFTAEYWNYACSSFNDFYLALFQTGASGIPADGNISFDSLNNPVSVNNGFFEVCNPKGCYSCPSGAGELAGTGMATGPEYGGGTVWLQTTAPVVPGETMVLELMVFDVSDGWLDSVSLLDAFEWSIDGSGVGTGPPG